ncbi:signal transduction histidine kinase [Rhodopirellula rubra]|uniref:histidine kinase n=1 Tax=Aporhodopirellula rubra TaxID=980271 RepID=A0A7W5DXZ3_9BACT|nr:signal transduction histidine kinase [Aporhodopirellula rubra]
MSAIRRSKEVMGGPLESRLEDVAWWIDESRNVARQLMNGITYPPAALEDPVGAAKEFLDDVLDLANTPHPPRVVWSIEPASGGTQSIPREAAIAIYRLTIEFVRNAVRHAEARLIEVSVKDWNQGVQICVQDDGTGYDLDAVSSDQVHGLTLARHRAESGGVELEIDSCKQRESTISKGTRVTMKVNL